MRINKSVCPFNKVKDGWSSAPHNFMTHSINHSAEYLRVNQNSCRTIYRNVQFVHKNYDEIIFRDASLLGNKFLLLPIDWNSD